MHETGYSGLVPWDDPEGWHGEGRGRGVQDGEQMYTCGSLLEKNLQKASVSQFSHSVMSDSL